MVDDTRESVHRGKEAKSTGQVRLEPLPIVRVLLLAFIKLHPQSTGYDLMGLISGFTEGLVDLKSGTVYTELRRLEKQGLVESVQESAGRKRRSYVISKMGRAELEQLTQQVAMRVNRVLLPLLSLIEQ